VMEATGVDLVDQFSERIAATYAKLDNGAQRVAIGMRWFVRHGQEDQVWGRAVARISDTAKGIRSILANYVRTDLYLGKKQEHFTSDDEKVALDLILGTCACRCPKRSRGAIQQQSPRRMCGDGSSCIGG
jgi:hypothetical protein